MSTRRNRRSRGRGAPGRVRTATQRTPLPARCQTTRGSRRNAGIRSSVPMRGGSRTTAARSRRSRRSPRAPATSAPCAALARRRAREWGRSSVPGPRRGARCRAHAPRGAHDPGRCRGRRLRGRARRTPSGSAPELRESVRREAHEQQRAFAAESRLQATPPCGGKNARNGPRSACRPEGSARHPRHGRRRSMRRRRRMHRRYRGPGRAASPGAETASSRQRSTSATARRLPWLLRRGGARDTPRRFRGPAGVVGDGDERDQGTIAHERRHQPVQAGSGQGAQRH